MASTSSGQPDTLDVRAQAQKGPFYVGQAIEVAVGVVAGRERPEITPPRIAQGRISLVGTAFRPISVSAIGDMINERNVYTYRYRIVPARPGRLVIAPFVACANEETGRSRPITVEVRPSPPGRPATFLGGVGPLTVKTEARPATVRRGDSFEYYIRLEGPGAIGSTGSPPDLQRLTALPIAPTVEAVAPEVVDQPSLRTLRYLVRPTKAGQATLPAIVVSWLDPRTGRYQAVLGPSVSVRVVDVPAIDSGHIEYSAQPERSSRSLQLVGKASLLMISGAGSLAAVLFALRGLRRRGARPAALARRWERSIKRQRKQGHIVIDRLACSIMDGLKAISDAGRDRSTGVLTPAEAQAVFESLTGNSEIGRQIGDLVRMCDQARFSGREASSAETAKLVESAVSSFRELTAACSPGPRQD